MLVSAYVKEARLRAGLSQAELARRAGTSQPTVARYENGRVVPSIATLERLLDACGLELSVRLVAKDPSCDENIDRENDRLVLPLLRRLQQRLADEGR